MSRKLDVAIAEALRYDDQFRQELPDAWIYHVPEYSIDGNAMLKLIAEMRRRQGYTLYMEYSYFLCKAVFTKGDPGDPAIFDLDDVTNNAAFADTMPKAVALAAYKALTGKMWQE